MVVEGSLQQILTLKAFGKWSFAFLFRKYSDNHQNFHVSMKFFSNLNYILFPAT